LLAAWLVLPWFVVTGCRPPQNSGRALEEAADDRPQADAGESAAAPSAVLDVLQAIEGAFGAVEREGRTIVGVDLALERASATDEVLTLALTLPNLKKFRLAGGSLSANVFVGLKAQEDLEELFLQDLTIADEELLSVLSALPKLRRLTLRRLPHISDAGIVPLFQFPTLRQLALIEMSITGFGALREQTMLTALDVRNCARLVPDDYRTLVRLTTLVDLKIGGFAVDDRCLEAVALLPALKGLTIDDSLVSAKGLAQFVTDSLSADSLETLVLNRNMSFSDEALLALGNLLRLKRLILGDAMVTGGFLARLAEDELVRPKLGELSLRKTLLTEQAIESLLRYPELRSLQISGTALTVEGAKTLLSLPWLERLDLTDCFLDDDTLRYLQESELPPSLKTFKY